LSGSYSDSLFLKHRLQKYQVLWGIGTPQCIAIVTRPNAGLGSAIQGVLQSGCQDQELP